MRYLLYKADEWIIPQGVPFIYSHALNRPLSKIAHCHDFYEIIYLFTGEAKHCINGNCYDMTEGDIAFLRPMEPHTFHSQSEELELFSISVTTEEMEGLLNAYHLKNDISKKKGTITFQLSRSIHHSLLSNFKQLDTCSNAQREANLRIILGDTLHEYLKLIANESNEWIDRVLLQMRMPSNLQEGIPAFLRVSNLSHPQLCRVIKKRTGKTPQQYIKELRMTYAYDLVVSTNLPFEDISLLVGYSSFSHFATSFKQQYGLSPSTLRKQSTLL